MRRLSRNLTLGGATVALSAAAGLTGLLVAPTAMAAGVISVDDLAEGEAGHFIDVRYDTCAGLEGRPAQIIVNGEATDGMQYALQDTVSFQGRQSFLVHAGRYSVTVGGVSTGPLGAADVKATDAGRTTVRLSTVCAAKPVASTASPSARPTTSTAAPSVRPTPSSTTTTVRVPTRIDTGVSPASNSSDQAPLGAYALVAVVGVGAAGATVLRLGRRAQHSR